MNRVLIAADESDDAMEVARTALRLFGESATYMVINVAEAPAMLWGADPMAWGAVYPLTIPVVSRDATPFMIGGPVPASGELGESVAEDIAEQRAEDVAVAADLPSAEAIGESARDVSHAIVTAAADHHADVIVVGSRDRGWMSRLVSPSISSEVTKHAAVPVLVVR